MDRDFFGDLSLNRPARCFGVPRRFAEERGDLLEGGEIASRQAAQQKLRGSRQRLGHPSFARPKLGAQVTADPAGKIARKPFVLTPEQPNEIAIGGKKRIESLVELPGILAKRGVGPFDRPADLLGKGPRRRGSVALVAGAELLA
jgi:hypothetical protein